MFLKVTDISDETILINLNAIIAITPDSTDAALCKIYTNDSTDDFYLIKEPLEKIECRVPVVPHLRY